MDYSCGKFGDCTFQPFRFQTRMNATPATLVGVSKNIHSSAPKCFLAFKLAKVLTILAILNVEIIKRSCSTLSRAKTPFPRQFQQEGWLPPTKRASAAKIN